MVPEMLWSLHFIQAQGYEAECVGLYQDNISTQLLIKNGKMSSGKKTKHIKAKFFFIKDRGNKSDGLSIRNDVGGRDDTAAAGYGVSSDASRVDELRYQLRGPS
jgi:hypothetical protein